MTENRDGQNDLMSRIELDGASVEAVERTYNAWLEADALRGSRWVRVLATVVMIGAGAGALLPDASILYARIFLFAGVLIGAACYQRATARAFCMALHRSWAAG
ncbi:hypothetical protein [Rhodopila sp.]|uniref:hypothetical protein n=1 Tax=Rhodopila sp. TaxID=2480087 RepID=UPI003D14BBF1